jgi:DNA-binding NarL/FixJ family response regulator
MITQKPKVILAESQELLRESLSVLLKTKPEIECIAEASNGKTLLDILKQKHADIVLLDTQLSQSDTWSTFEVIKKRFPETRVILFSPPENLHLMPEYMTQGANCFLSKTCSLETLLKAIHTVKTEGFFFDNATSRIMLDTMIKAKSGHGIFTETDFSDRETYM